MTRRTLPLLALLALPACLSPDSQIAECRAVTLIDWHKKAHRLCPPGAVYWDDCAHAAALDAELGERLAECIR